ncbi:hypothetical protein A4A49_52151 [Nicotiana attenuata]|uniref:Uncharacterized protein n=1 Tax=Nicotiana attenuata TaxID=49451 RepID=A0A314KH29_NICAT|nr:hypothetical protein A4A49_52151 [Nicotiana attenuata]
MSIADSTYPFYLHSSNSLVNSIFDEKGYGDCHRSILFALPDKNNDGFIDGTILQPNISAEFLQVLDTLQRYDNILAVEHALKEDNA